MSISKILIFKILSIHKKNINNTKKLKLKEADMKNLIQTN